MVLKLTIVGKTLVRSKAVQMRWTGPMVRMKDCQIAETGTRKSQNMRKATAWRDATACERESEREMDVDRERERDGCR